jgi:glycosyltransferase involved in cell wall biosynthesis
MSRPAPAVSVIVCFLDEERFLGEAVASVVAQRFTDWELLLVDDGSRDGSTALARELAARDPGRMTCIEHDGHRNLGLSASRNVGVARARGRYIAFLDADDVWHPDKLEQQVALMAQQPRAAMVMGASQYWRSWAPASAPGADRVVPIGAAADCLYEPPSLMTTLYPLGTGAAPPPSNLLLRRNVVQAVGGFEASFRGALMLYEDQAFLSKVYRSHPVYVASACWDRYRQRPDSIVARQTAAGRYWQVRSHFLAWLQRDLARTGGAPDGVGERLAHARRGARRQRMRAALVAAVRRVLPAPAVRGLQRVWRSARGRRLA